MSYQNQNNRSSKRLKLLVVTKFNTLYFRNIHDLKGLKNVEIFIRRFHILVMKTFEDYVNRIVDRSRTRIVCVLTLIDLFMLLR